MATAKQRGARAKAPVKTKGREARESAGTTWTSNLVGPAGQLFADPTPTPDERGFQVDNTSSEYYNSPYYKQHENEILPVPTGPPQAPLELKGFVGEEFLKPIANANKIAFHAVGDTGASATSRIAKEALVADAMAADLQQPAADAPAFLFHLGDVIYQFGEAEYYYDQFYEPFRGYDRPIFAIPGNHDAAVTYTKGDSTPDTPSLQAFIANFCAPAPERPQNGGGLARTTMTQPGVYFTLEAPFVAIVGLYTNVLDGPGVLTDQNGAYPELKDDGQYGWLVDELKRLAPKREALECAVILACHHPPVSADKLHGGSTGLSQDLDKAFEEAGLWPDAVISGHAHIYQRFARSRANGGSLPYVVSGSGGHAKTLPPGEQEGEAGTKWGDFTLVKGPILEYGYLTITVDMRNESARTLTIAFTQPANPAAADHVTVPLT
jgi:Calcineurin-like phosphoesterase